MSVEKGMALPVSSTNLKSSGETAVDALDPRKYSPFMAPDWRWQAVLERRESGLRRKPLEDRLIDPGVAYLKDVHRVGQVRADRRWQVLAAAYSIYKQAGPLRDEIEARLLTDVPHENVALKTGAETAVILAFEQFFFNVSDRLDAGDWVMAQAVGVFPGTTLTEGKIWKYLGYAGGPAVLDVMVDDFHGRPDADIAGRSLQAQKGRFCVRQVALSRSDVEANGALLKDALSLFPQYRDLFRSHAKLFAPARAKVVVPSEASDLRAKRRRSKRRSPETVQHRGERPGGKRSRRAPSIGAITSFEDRTAAGVDTDGCEELDHMVVAE